MDTRSRGKDEALALLSQKHPSLSRGALPPHGRARTHAHGRTHGGGAKTAFLLAQGQGRALGPRESPFLTLPVERVWAPAGS